MWQLLAVLALEANTSSQEGVGALEFLSLGIGQKPNHPQAEKTQSRKSLGSLPDTLRPHSSSFLWFYRIEYIKESRNEHRPLHHQWLLPDPGTHHPSLGELEACRGLRVNASVAVRSA